MTLRNQGFFFQSRQVHVGKITLQSKARFHESSVIALYNKVRGTYTFPDGPHGVADAAGRGRRRSRRVAWSGGASGPRRGCLVAIPSVVCAILAKGFCFSDTSS